MIDGSFVLADPNPARSGTAYALWQKANGTGTTRNQYVSHTIDGGKTWSPPAQIPSATLQVAGTLLALPDGPQGTLVDIVNEIPPQPGAPVGKLTGPTTLMARRSTDLGTTWSPPTPIAVADPELLVGVSAALAPDNRTIVASCFQSNPRASSTFNLMYSTSSDDGRTWSSPATAGATVDRPLLAGLGKQIVVAPNLAIAADGTVGAMFYEHRNDLNNNPPRITDLWFRHSQSTNGRIAGWTTDAHVAGPFNLAEAPLGDIGEYQGLASVPKSGDFAATFTLAAPLAGANFTLPNPPTDIFLAGLSPR